MSGTGSLLDAVQLADTLGTAGVRSPQVSVLWGTVKHIRQGSRALSLLHSSGRSKVPSDVQQAVSRSGMSVRKLSLYTPAGRKAGARSACGTGTEKRKFGGEAAELIPFASWAQSSAVFRRTGSPFIQRAQFTPRPGRDIRVMSLKQIEKVDHVFFTFNYLST
ncbi:hypothetical protein QVD17_08790 [Tagetes erecta]|uniref:Uncharacterized protein n=1 Tax=Tagetes erecta TaxID=13708 RepID=A0AAD8L3A6_TARER|nr:hypothetical protein QVD17_08790 [Tagetes erecta]